MIAARARCKKKNRGRRDKENAGFRIMNNKRVMLRDCAGPAVQDKELSIT